MVIAHFAGAPQNNPFTTPAGSSQFPFSYRVRLDKGWLAFNNLQLAGRSEAIPATGGDQYELSLQIAGHLQAGLGEAGQVWIHFDAGPPELIWQNPADFNSAGVEVNQTFTAPASATEMEFSYMVVMDSGWLAYAEPELQWLRPEYTITRKTYSLAGQTIAIRISGDPASGNNGIFYYLTDHLGSTSALLTSSNGIKGGSMTRYHPFGSYRGAAPSQTITDRNFTGQKHNMDIGLYYYNARYYLPGIGRFASADIIVPDPMNPQQYNRYTYTLNNPLRYTDPTGHCAESVPIGDVHICSTIYDIDDAEEFLAMIDAYLWLHNRTYINFWEAVSLDRVAAGKLTRDEFANVILQAAPQLGSRVAGWVATLALAPITNHKGNENAHVSLHIFRDLLEDAIRDWRQSGRDDLFMNVNVYNSLGTFGRTVFSVNVRSRYYLNEYGWTYDTIYSERLPTEGWGNDFHNLIDSLLVEAHGQIGIGFAKQTWWKVYSYSSTWGIEEIPYRRIGWNQRR